MNANRKLLIGDGITIPCVGDGCSVIDPGAVHLAGMRHHHRVSRADSSDDIVWRWTHDTYDSRTEAKPWVTP